jgi:hypothetical protein
MHPIQRKNADGIAAAIGARHPPTIFIAKKRLKTPGTHKADMARLPPE